MPKTVVAKKSCCKDKPRCKKCPVVLKRLEAAGLAARVEKRTYLVADDVRKRDMRAARAPKARTSD